MVISHTTLARGPLPHRAVTNTGSYRGSDEVRISLVAPVTEEARRERQEVKDVDFPVSTSLSQPETVLCVELRRCKSAH